MQFTIFLWSIDDTVWSASNLPDSPRVSHELSAFPELCSGLRAPDLDLEWVRLVTVGILVRNLHAVRSTQRGKYSTVSFILAGSLPSGIVRRIEITVGDGGEIWPRITHKKCGLQKLPSVFLARRQFANVFYFFLLYCTVSGV